MDSEVMCSTEKDEDCVVISVQKNRGGGCFALHESVMASWSDSWGTPKRESDDRATVLKAEARIGALEFTNRELKHQVRRLKKSLEVAEAKVSAYDALSQEVAALRAELERLKPTETLADIHQAEPLPRTMRCDYPGFRIV